MLAQLSTALFLISLVSATPSSSSSTGPSVGTTFLGCTSRSQVAAVGATSVDKASDIGNCAASCQTNGKWYSFYSTSDGSCLCVSNLSVERSTSTLNACSEYSISIIQPSLSSTPSTPISSTSPSPSPSSANLPSIQNLAVSAPDSASNEAILSPGPKVPPKIQKRNSIPNCQANELACATLGGAGDGYECVDVASSAKYCGGCPYGLFGQDASSASGTDCTVSGPLGASHLSTICYNSACAATECQPGYKWLPDGSCIWKGLPGSQRARAGPWGSRV